MLILGVDGGGTKTHYALYDTESEILRVHTGLGTNYESMPGGYVELEERLNADFNTLFEGTGARPSDVSNAVFGMGGVDTKIQQSRYRAILSRMGFTRMLVVNDAYLGVKAAHKYGIAAVNGSGFCVAGIDGNGLMTQVGGVGHQTGDKGGGFYYAPEAVSAVYAALYKRGETTALTGMLSDLLAIDKGIADFTESLHNQTNNNYRPFSKDVIQAVFTASANGDAVATDILTRSGDAYGESIVAAADLLAFTSVDVSLTGSLFRYYPNSEVVAAIKRHFAAIGEAERFAVSVSSDANVLGALLWAYPMDKEKIAQKLAL